MARFPSRWHPLTTVITATKNGSAGCVLACVTVILMHACRACACCVRTMSRKKGERWGPCGALVDKGGHVTRLAGRQAASFAPSRPQRQFCAASGALRKAGLTAASSCSLITDWAYRNAHHWLPNQPRRGTTQHTPVSQHCGSADTTKTATYLSSRVNPWTPRADGSERHCSCTHRVPRHRSTSQTEHPRRCSSRFERASVLRSAEAVPLGFQPSSPP